MPVDRAQTSEGSREPGGPTAADLIDQVGRFDGPPEQFLAHLVAIQCRIGPAEGGAVLRPGAQERIGILAVHPPLAEGAIPPRWLAEAAESAPQVISTGRVIERPLHSPEDLYGQPARRHLIVLPIRGAGATRGAAAFVFEASDPAALAARRERLEFSLGLLSLYEMRQTLTRRVADLARLRRAMEVLSALNGQDRFTGAAMLLCNEVASRWDCDRVSLGFLKGRYVCLRAMSHTEKFSRKMKIVQDVEAAMEECLDQDVEVIYPAEAESAYVSRAAGDLSKRHGPMTVLSLPIRRGGAPVAVLTLERPANQTFNPDEIESLRLTCDLCTARLVDLEAHDRWFGARVAVECRKALATLLGPKHTWLKVAAILAFAAAIFLVFAKGDYRVDAPFVVEAIEQQVIPAPFDGYLKTVSVDVGDAVKGGETILATLETAELRLQLAAAKAERIGHLKEASTARRDRKEAEAQIAEAQADKVAAQIDLLEYRINQAQVVSPITGRLVSGDLKREVGAPVKTGQVLFEVAPLESLRAELAVPEDLIAEVEQGQEGELATAGYPETRIRFVVERVNPIAEVVKQRNVFKVRVRLAETPPWMRPGMEGVAKISIDRRHLLWIWTRRLVNWVRMKLWF